MKGDEAAPAASFPSARQRSTRQTDDPTDSFGRPDLDLNLHYDPHVGAQDGIIRGEDGVARCWWADSAPEYRAYHDAEWGVPVADDIRLFEKLSLEGFQAGLSWLTILRKREAFRAAFAGFDFAQVARFGQRELERLARHAGH